MRRGARGAGGEPGRSIGVGWARPSRRLWRLLLFNMLNIEDLIRGMGKRAVLTVYTPTAAPPRFADFTIMWARDGAVLVKFYRPEELGDICGDLAGIETELAFRELRSVAGIYFCGLNIFERIKLAMKMPEALTVSVGRNTCLYVHGSPRFVADVVSRAFKCKEDFTWADPTPDSLNIKSAR